MCVALDPTTVYPAEPVADEGVGQETAPRPLVLTLETEHDFDLCVWQYDGSWRGAGAYTSCRGEGGAFPLHNPDRDSVGQEGDPHETLMLGMGVPDAETYMACVVPAVETETPVEWIFRVMPGDSDEGDDT